MKLKTVKIFVALLLSFCFLSSTVIVPTEPDPENAVMPCDINGPDIEKY